MPGVAAIAETDVDAPPDRVWDEAAHAQQNWQTMLGQLKRVVEAP